MTAKSAILLTLLGAICLSYSASGAQTAVPLSWERICEASPCRVGGDGVREAKISPDGTALAVTGLSGGQEGIFFVPVEGGKPEFWVSGSSPVWFHDGQRIVFVQDGDLWTVARGSSQATRLTDDDEGERAPRPSPDGKQIGFYSDRSGYQDVWVVAADGSSDPIRITENSMAADDSRFTFSWAPDGKQIAYYSNKSNYWEDDLWIVDVAASQERQISRNLMGRSEPAWSPDGSRIAILGTAKSEFWYSDLVDIYLIDANTGAETRVPMETYATERGDVTWSGDGSELFFLSLERGETELSRVPATGGVATRVTNMGGLSRGYDASENGEAFIFVRSTPTRGYEADLVSAEGGLLRRKTEFSTAWENINAPHQVSYRSWDGLYIHGFLFLPPDFDESRQYPALVQVHGGGTNSYYNGINLVEQYLAQSGYVVLAVNYRGGSGYGRGFQDLGVNDWANGQALDAAAAADYLRAQRWSSGKVGIYGYSYGGITSMAAITRAPEAFDAAVPMAGIYDFGDAYVTADRVGKLFTREGHGGPPEERAAIYEKSNSIARIENIETPVLIMHGEADVRAPFRQYGLAVDALKRHNKVFESHSFPGEPHGFRDPKNRIELYRRLEAWFDKWLR